MALHICEGEGTPIGNVVPTKLSQHYTDTLNGHTWISHGLTDLDWVEVGSGTFAGDTSPSQAQDDRLEPSGFIRSNPETMGIMEISNNGVNISRIDENSNYSENTLSTFYDGTVAAERTFRIMPKVGENLIVWIGGDRMIIPAQSVQLPDVNDTHIIYLDENGILKTITPIIGANFKAEPIVAIAYWNVTQQEYFLFAEERHGIEMSGSVHEYLHKTVGAKYISGMNPLGIVDESTTFTGIDSGSFADEDIIHSLPLQNNIPFWYLDGMEWKKTTPDNKAGYIDSGDTYVSANTFNGSGYELEELSEDEAMYVFIVASNDAKNPYAKMLGQYKYSNANNAEGSLVDHFKHLNFSNAPSPEFIVIGAYIIDANGSFSIRPCGCDFYDFRIQEAYSRFGEGVTFVQDDSTLSNGSSSYSQYLTMNTQDNEMGRYRIGFQATWNINTTSRNIQIIAVVNGVTIGLLEMETKDSGSDVRNPTYGAFYYDLLSDGDMNVTLEFRPENSSDIAYIYSGMIEKWRIS